MEITDSLLTTDELSAIVGGESDVESPILGRLDEPTSGVTIRSQPPAGSESGSEAVPEGGLFDLASELGSDESDEPPPEPVVQEKSVNEIVEDFKRGVAANLALDDFDTHYNLGIAYREMGLLDEAIGEFQTAARTESHVVDCCAMLGECMREKGLMAQAVKWYRTGIEAPSATPEQRLEFLYEIGDCYAALGERDDAYKAFAEVYGIDSNYRDVVVRLTEFGR